MDGTAVRLVPDGAGGSQSEPRWARSGVQGRQVPMVAQHQRGSRNDSSHSGRGRC